MKLFCSARKDDLKPIDAINELLENMKVDRLKGTNNPFTQANRSEGNAHKSGGPEVHLNLSVSLLPRGRQGGGARNRGK